MPENTPITKADLKSVVVPLTEMCVHNNQLIGLLLQLLTKKLDWTVEEKATLEKALENHEQIQREANAAIEVIKKA